MTPSSSSLQLKPGHFSVSGERDSETRWTQILGFCFFLVLLFFSLLCWMDIGTSSRCYCYRVFEEVGLRKDGEYDDDNNNSPLMSGILTRPGAELKPDWTAFWWKHVLAAVLGHILYLKDKMLFFLKNIACGGGVHRCVDREFIFELRATVQEWIKLRPWGKETESVHLIFIYLHSFFVLFF